VRSSSVGSAEAAPGIASMTARVATSKSGWLLFDMDTSLVRRTDVHAVTGQYNLKPCAPSPTHPSRCLLLEKMAAYCNRSLEMLAKVGRELFQTPSKEVRRGCKR
jgi:hypothetical protein